MDHDSPQTTQDGVHHSKPIPISTQHLRHRSTSFSSDSSNSSNSSASPPLLTPNNFLNTRIPVSSSSPILYFLSQSSPTKTSATFPFRGFIPPPLVEDEPVEERPAPTQHARRASTAGRFQPQPPMLEPHHERGVNVLRRLSLSGRKPSAPDIPQPGSPMSPPNLAVSCPPITETKQHTRKSRRSATVTEHARPRRAPSPMGERILKGHFDGFN